MPTTRHTGGPLDPVLARIASTISSEGVEVDESGVLLLWVIAKGGVCITSSSDEGRIAKMAALDKVRDLKEEEVRDIDEAGGKVHFRQWVCLFALFQCLTFACISASTHRIPFVSISMEHGLINRPSTSPPTSPRPICPSACSPPLDRKCVGDKRRQRADQVIV